MPRSSELTELEIDLNGSVVKLVERTTPLTEVELKEILDPKNETIRIKLKKYLTERYCTAINHGIVDKDFAKSVFGVKFIRHYKQMFPFIDCFRRRHNAHEYYIETQKVAEHWRAKYVEPKVKY